MRRIAAVFAVAFFVLGFAVPVWADTGNFLAATKDKAVRGIENGLFGMGGEVYHNIDARSKSRKNVLEGWTLGFFDGLHSGLKRTVIGAYELATPFYHDEALLPSLDKVIKS